MNRLEQDLWRASILNNPVIDHRTREDMTKLLDVITKYGDLLRGFIGMVESMDKGMCHPQFKKQYLELARAALDGAAEQEKK